jgi:hypothetical protein
MGQLEARQAEIEAALQHAEEPPPPLHPVMATLYREKVAQLSSALAHEDTKLEAAGILCGLVEKVVSPAEGGFALDLHRIWSASWRWPRTRSSPPAFWREGCKCRWLRGPQPASSKIADLRDPVVTLFDAQKLAAAASAAGSARRGADAGASPPTLFV